MKFIKGGKEEEKKLNGLDVICNVEDPEPGNYEKWTGKTINAHGTPLTLEMLQWYFWRAEGVACPRLVEDKP